MFRQQQAPAAPPVPQAPATHSPAPALGLQGVLEMMKQMQPQAPFQQPQQTQTAMAPNFGAMFSQLAGMNQQGGLPPQHPSTQEDAERKRMRDNVQYDNQYDSQWARGKRTKSNDPKPVSTALAAFTILSGPDSNPLDSTRLVSLRASSGPRGNAERVKTAPSVTTPKSFHLRSLPDVIWSLRLIPGIFRATAFPRLQQFFFLTFFACILYFIPLNSGNAFAPTWRKLSSARRSHGVSWVWGRSFHTEHLFFCAFKDPRWSFLHEAPPRGLKWRFRSFFLSIISTGSRSCSCARILAGA